MPQVLRQFDSDGSGSVELGEFRDALLRCSEARQRPVLLTEASRIDGSKVYIVMAYIVMAYAVMAYIVQRPVLLTEASRIDGSKVPKPPVPALSIYAITI